MSYDNLIKLANKREEEKKEKSKQRALAESVGGLIVGKKALDHGAERMLGVQRIVHGTSEESAKKILDEGLLSEYGGGDAGSSKHLGGELGDEYAKTSKGRVHVFKDTPFHRRLASGHAALASGDDGQTGFAKGIFGFAGPGKKGKRVYGAIPYDLIENQFELDPDYENNAFRSRAAGTGDIDAKHLSNKRMGLLGIIKNRSDDIMGYAKRNKGRFGLGVGLTGLGGLAAYKSGKNVYDHFKKEKRDKS